MTVNSLNNYMFKITELKMLMEILEQTQVSNHSEIDELDLKIDSLNEEFKNTGIDINNIAELKIRLAIQKENFITQSSWNLDIDNSGKAEPFTDGFLILRKMFGSVFDGDALTNGLITSNATRTNSTEIHEYIQRALDDNKLDIDGSGKAEPFRDGFLILRKMFGSVFDGDALTNGLITSNATRRNSADIHAYIDNLMPPSSSG